MLVFFCSILQTYNVVAILCTAGPMYYVPAAPPEPIRSGPYFPHPPPPGVVMPGHDPSPFRAMVIKQIEYYFMCALPKVAV